MNSSKDGNTFAARVGRSLRIRRIELGLTQKALAVRVGMSCSSYACIESGSQYDRIESLQRICLELGTSIAAVLNDAQSSAELRCSARRATRRSIPMSTQSAAPHVEQ